MAKFSQIAKGTRALKPVEFSLLDGETKATCSLRPLLGQDDALILAEARAFAVSKGLTDPKNGDPIYELARAVNVCLVACCDSDDPTGKTPFFASAAEILGNLDRERIFLLSEMQARHQDETSPHPSSMSGDEYIATMLAIATAEAGAELPFVSWPRSLLESCLVFSANLLLSSLSPKSPSGSASETSESAKSPSLHS